MFGVYRVMRDGTHRYVARTASHSEKLACEIADDLSNGRIVMPDGSTRECKAHPHIAKAIGGE